ncbi:MAG TPA: hypothetical protein VI819_03995 [Patescibacteria group bacterium]|nr:hypothetical protein [Patescibacteria group bacterium]
MTGIKVELEGGPVIEGQEYPRITPDGRVIAADPSKVHTMRRGFAFNHDGTAKSTAEIEGKNFVPGPDDGYKLG